MRPVQRRRTAYNIDYAALNEGVGDDDNNDFDDFDNVGGAGADGANDEISAGEESLFKQQDPVLLRNATLETECAPAMVRRRDEWIKQGNERKRERERGLLLLLLRPPLSSLNLLPLSLFPPSLPEPQR